jgi:hypothetical protein
MTRVEFEHHDQRAVQVPLPVPLPPACTASPTTEPCPPLASAKGNKYYCRNSSLHMMSAAQQVGQHQSKPWHKIETHTCRHRDAKAHKLSDRLSAAILTTWPARGSGPQGKLSVLLSQLLNVHASQHCAFCAAPMCANTELHMLSRSLKLHADLPTSLHSHANHANM